MLPFSGERGVLDEVASDSDDALSWARPRFAVVVVSAISQPTMQMRGIGSAGFIAPHPFAIAAGCCDQVIRMNSRRNQFIESLPSQAFRIVRSGWIFRP